MATFIVQGRFAASSVRALVTKPQDRRAEAAKLVKTCGGKLKDYYMTTGEKDFLVIIEADDGEAAVAAGLAAGAGGTVTDVTTTRAWTTKEFKQLAERAKKAVGAYRPPA